MLISNILTSVLFAKFYDELVGYIQLICFSLHYNKIQNHIYMKKLIALWLLTATLFSVSGQDLFDPYNVIFEQSLDKKDTPPLRPKDEMQPFGCMYTGTGLDFTFTDSMGTVRIVVTNLSDGSESTYSVWTPAVNYTIPVQPDTPYQITVTFHSGDIFVGVIK